MSGHESKGPKSGSCKCPYCEQTLPGGGTVCAPCGVSLLYCDECGRPLPAGASECPDCNPKTRKGAK